MNILAVVAHPDDEVLGVGATLACHAMNGDTVDVFMLADGESSRADAASREAISRRQDAARSAANALGLREPRFAQLPDNRLDGMPLIDVVKRVEDVVKELRPELIYTHSAYDLNIDHRIVHQAVLTTCRPLPGASVRRIYAFETPSSTEWTSPASSRQFSPVRFVNVAQGWPRKLSALDAYAGEMRAFPHPRSIQAIEALARWRGATAGFEYAEAFEVIRDLVP